MQTIFKNQAEDNLKDIIYNKNNNKNHSTSNKEILFVNRPKFIAEQKKNYE